MESTIFERLAKVYDLTNTNANSLAKKINVPRGTMYNLDSQKTDNPTMQFLISLETYTGISMVWFATGKGEIYVKDRDSKASNVSNTAWEKERDFLINLLKEKEEIIRDKDKLISNNEFMANLFKIQKMKDPEVASFIKANTFKGKVIKMYPNGYVPGVTSGVGLVS